MSKYRLAVVGFDIQYSQSPSIHQSFAKAADLSLEYTIVDISRRSELANLNPSEAFKIAIQELIKEGFSGCNITKPYKEIAYKLAHEHTQEATVAGAANTFKFEQGRIIAHNTDGIGFLYDITVNLKCALNHQSILILGAGGAVRGILGPLLALDPPPKVIIVNRTLEKALELKNYFPSVAVCRVENLTPYHFDGIIDAMSTDDPAVINPLLADVQFNDPDRSWVYDLKYAHPEGLPSLKFARAHHVQVISDGAGMLVEQAAEAFCFWTGVRPFNTSQVKELLCGQKL